MISVHNKVCGYICVLCKMIRVHNKVCGYICVLCKMISVHIRCVDTSVFYVK